MHTAQCEFCGRLICCTRLVPPEDPSGDGTWRTVSRLAHDRETCLDGNPHTPIVRTIDRVDPDAWDRQQEACGEFHNRNKTVEEVEDELAPADEWDWGEDQNLVVPLIILLLFFVFFGFVLVFMPNPIWRTLGGGLLILAGTVWPELAEEIDKDNE